MGGHAHLPGDLHPREREAFGVTPGHSLEVEKPCAFSAPTAIRGVTRSKSLHSTTDPAVLSQSHRAEDSGFCSLCWSRAL